MSCEIIQADCLDWSRSQLDNSVDLVIGSPPYENARSYSIGFNLTGQAWVDWAVERFVDQVRICSGLVCWVVEGTTRQFRWSATPALLMADLHRAGIRLRKPPIYRRNGIFGGGGPDWWRNDYEFCVCASKGRLPWSNNKATGKPPKCRPGGAPSNRMKSGKRVRGNYTPPDIANPGNVIDCGAVGGGNLGSQIAHENEAPYPDRLARPFVISFCRPGGRVFDPFSGSGTTAAVCVSEGRKFVGTDIRPNQVELTSRRIVEAEELLAAAV